MEVNSFQKSALFLSLSLSLSLSPSHPAGVADWKCSLDFYGWLLCGMDITCGPAHNPALPPYQVHECMDIEFDDNTFRISANKSILEMDIIKPAN